MERIDLPCLVPSWIAALSARVSLERGEVLGSLPVASTDSTVATAFLGLPGPNPSPAAQAHLWAVRRGIPTSLAALPACEPSLTRSTTLSHTSLPYIASRPLAWCNDRLNSPCLLVCL